MSASVMNLRLRTSAGICQPLGWEIIGVIAIVSGLATGTRS